MIPSEELDKQDMPIPIVISLEYSIQYELASKPVDYFIRRTGALFFDIGFVRRWKENVIEYMAKKLKWSEEEKVRYTKELDHALHDAAVPKDY